ncbi:MAG: ABC transporter ATP-binding protein [Syntrophobacterales bacterium]|jgi:ABC-2 type transport system ATP-binding protein|nr:ABC transporter ATP-binding protein [Syntrophobacterales bacterium]
MESAISAQGIDKAFRGGFFGPAKEVLRRVDLEVAPGAIFGILGPNGAGKTTLISILATLLRPDAGTAQVLGLDIVRDAARLKERINLAASGAHFLWCLTVEDNLRFYGHLYGLGGPALTARVAELLDSFGLAEHRRVTFERLSTGLKQRLSLAKALINQPELLFLDEPTSGLDQDMAHHLRKEILRLNRDTGVTILLTTHNLREAETLCTEVAFLKEGRLVSEGRIPELQQRLGLGDHLSLIFAASPPPLDYGRLPGVLRYRLEDSRVDLVLDRVEERLPDILAAVQQTGQKPARVKVKPVDLEEIYREITH